jgi:hypothetical protein
MIGKLGLVALILTTALAYGMSNTWRLKIGQSLVCSEEVARSDLILVENFDPDYLVFERAAELQRAGLASRALVPFQISPEPGKPDKRPYAVSKGIAELMSRLARIEDPEFAPIQAIEPISLNAAYQIRELLVKAHVRSVIVVTPGLRSKRSSLIYNAVLAPAGIKAYCVPVFGLDVINNWTGSWHDIQEIGEQFLKLTFYRLHVL